MPRRLTRLAGISSGRLALLLAAALLGGGATLHAAPAPDPLLGTWRITGGGSGTIAVSQTSSLLAIRAGSTGVSLGCVGVDPGGIVGFVELPSHTALPKGVYDSSFGGPGQGCAYNVKLVLDGDALSGTVTYSENDQPGGPFTFVRVGAKPSSLKTYAWKVTTRAAGTTLRGSGRVTVDARGKAVGSTGSLAAAVQSARWTMTVDPPGSLKRGAKGAFTLTLTVHVTTSTCNERLGTLVVSKGRATVTGICGADPIATHGTTTLR